MQSAGAFVSFGKSWQCNGYAESRVAPSASHNFALKGKGNEENQEIDHQHRHAP